MLQIIAFCFFAGLLVGLGLLLQIMIRDNWADMAAAFMGRPMPSRMVTPRASPARAKARAVRMRRAAA